MKSFLTAAAFVLVLLMVVVSPKLLQSQSDPGKTTIKGEHGSMNLTQLVNIQPGLGTVMMEYGKRYYVMYYAAKSGNWDLADYQLKEALEIQEVGEATRPGRASDLKDFEDEYLKPLGADIKAKDWGKFEKDYMHGIEGCNDCHYYNDFGFIEYRLPSTPPDLPYTGKIDMGEKSKKGKKKK
jgi:hypothetical protein